MLADTVKKEGGADRKQMRETTAAGSNLIQITVGRFYCRSISKNKLKSMALFTRALVY